MTTPPYSKQDIQPSFHLRYTWTGWPTEGTNFPSQLDDMFFRELDKAWTTDRDAGDRHLVTIPCRLGKPRRSLFFHYGLIFTGWRLIRMMPGFCSLIVLIFAGCMLLLQPALFTDELVIQQGDESRDVVTKILDQWQARRHKVETLKIVAVGQTVLAKGSFGDGNPKTDLAIPLKRTWYIDLVNGWFRRDTVTFTIGVDGNSTTPSSEILVYDGAKFRSFHPPNENRRIGKSANSISFVDYGSEVDVSVACTLTDLPIMFSIGCISWVNEGFRKTLEIPYEARDYEVLDLVSRPGIPVTLTKRASEATRNSLVEYLVDPEKDGAILAYRISPAGDVPTFGSGGGVVTIETEFAESQSSWFPSKWQVRVGEGAGIVESTSLVVEEIKFNLDFERKFFQISDDVLK